MAAMDKEEIARVVLRGVGEDYSHAIIWCDTWDYTDYVQYVPIKKDIDEVIKEKFRYGNMDRIMEIYNYNLSILDQLNAREAYNKKRPENKDNEYGIPNMFFSNDLKKAIDLAKEVHEGQIRKDGVTPYINHPLTVLKLAINYLPLFSMQTLKDLQDINDVFIGCVLHDVLEMGAINAHELEQSFPSYAVKIVLELTNDEAKINLLGKTKYLQAKMLDMSIGAMFVKLCDRLANLQDLATAQDKEFQKNYFQETYDIITYLLKTLEFNPFHLAVIKDILEELKKLEKDLAYDFDLTSLEDDLDNPNILALKPF